MELDRVRVNKSIYLTAVLKIALGLVLFLALGACQGSGETTPSGTPAPEGRRTPTPVVTKTRSAGQLPARTPISTSAVVTPVAPVSSIDVQAADLQGVRVSFWHVWTGEAGEVLQGIVDEFNRTNRWGIEVELTAFEGYGRLAEAVSMIPPGDDWPDLLVGHIYQAQRWDTGRNTLVDLNVYVNDPEWGFTSEEQADFFPVFWEQDIGTGYQRSDEAEKRLGIPWQRSALVIFYNVTWAEVLGYDEPPDTPFNFRVQACAAAKAGNQGGVSGGGWLITPEASTLAAWIYAFGGEIIAPDGRGYLFNTPEGERALAFLRGLVDDQCAWVADDLDPRNEFAARRALFLVESISGLSLQEVYFEEMGSDDEWRVIPFPSANGQPVIDAYGPSLLVARSTPEEQLATWLLVKWLASPQSQAKWVQSSGYYPTRQSALDYLGRYVNDNPRWAESLELIPYARVEPPHPSWSVVRWAMGDAMAQLFSSDFEADQVPSLLEMLDQVAMEIHSQIR